MVIDHRECQGIIWPCCSAFSSRLVQFSERPSNYVGSAENGGLVDWSFFVFSKPNRYFDQSIMTVSQSNASIDDHSTKGWKIGKWLLKGLFSHLGLFILVGAYCVGGAYLFQYIEEDGVVKKNSVAVATSKEIENQRTQLAHDLWMYKWSVDFETTVGALVNQYHDNVTSMILLTDKYVGIPLDNTDLQDTWIFSSALLFTITIVTTIGYGNVTPVTPTGQLTVIFYALIGVPLMLMFLANIGDAMASFFRLAYGRGCCYFCWKKRKANYELNKQRLREMREHGRPLTMYEGAAGHVDYRGKVDPNHAANQIEIVEMMEDPDEEVINVPISLTLVVIAAYVFIGAVLFASWNKWSWIKGAYFSFVTLSTIGFGDLVPGWEEVGSTQGDLKLAISCVYIVFGLAVLSMSFNLMMEEMFSKFKWLGAKLGIVNDPAVGAKNDDKKPLIQSADETPVHRSPTDDRKSKDPIHLPQHPQHHQQQHSV